MKMRARTAPTTSLLCLLAAGLALSWTAGSAMVRGGTSAVAPVVAPARDLRLRTRDGVIIAATYRPGKAPDAPAVLLLHGVGASRSATAPNAAWLASKGYSTLAIDFRGHGESGGAVRSFGLDEALDASAAFAWLKRRQHGARVAIIGISTGGAASLLGRSGPIPADALVLQAVYPDIRHAIRDRIADRLSAAPAWVLEPLLSFQALPRFGVWPSRLSPLRALKHYPGPVLIIGGSKDRYTPLNETRALFAAAPGPKSLWLVPDGDHAGVSDLRDAAYRQRVGAFLEKSIGVP